MKSISIIIVNYNTGKFILQCIASIKSYAPGDTEIIIVDNASTDGSLEELRKVKGLIIIEGKKNVGYSGAVNKGLKAAKGDYIFVLNPDTQITKGSIKILLEFAESNKCTGVIAPKLLNPNGSVQPSCYHEPNLLAAFREYFWGIKGSFQKYAPRGPVPVRVDAVVGAAMLIPREVVNMVGMFDEHYFMYFEDLDYCRRVRKEGWDIYYLPSSKVYHEHGGVTRTVPENARRWIVESSIMYHGKMGHNLLTLILWLGQKWSKFNESI